MAGWSEVRVWLKHHMNDFPKLNRVTGRQRRIVTCDDLLVEAVHVVCLEGWPKGGHLVQDASKGPNVTLEVVWPVFPNLRTGIVWRASLGMKKTFLVINDFGDVKIC